MFQATDETSAELFGSKYIPTVTGGLEHAKGRLKNTKHPDGDGLDIRLNDIPYWTVKIKGVKSTLLTIASEWAGRIKAKLGIDYDVVIHGKIENGSIHIHIEYDVKRSLKAIVARL